jgi:antitoxin VapB
MRRLREPTATYDAAHRAAAPAPTPARRRPRAKVITTGRSQAVRLPRGFHVDGTELAIHREGDRIVLEPIDATPRDAHGWPAGLWGELRRLEREAPLDELPLEDDPPPQPLPG